MIVDEYMDSKEGSAEAGGWCFIGIVAFLVVGCVLAVAGLV